MTKGQMKRMLSMYENLQEEAEKIKSRIIKEIALQQFGTDDEENLSLAEKEIKEHGISEKIEKLNFPEDNEKVNLPRLVLLKGGFGFNPEIRVKSNGGELVAGVETSEDYEQIWLGCTLRDGEYIDLALAEVKKGELAESMGYNEKDGVVDVYIYSDTDTDDYTSWFSVNPRELYDADMTERINDFFRPAMEEFSDETDFYNELLKAGITADMVRKYRGDEAANHMEEYCFSHGLFGDAEVEKLWDELEDATMVEAKTFFPETGSDTLVLNSNFHFFPAGTSQEDLWHWFNENHSKGLSFLVEGK